MFGKTNCTSSDGYLGVAFKSSTACGLRGVLRSNGIFSLLTFMRSLGITCSQLPSSSCCISSHVASLAVVFRAAVRMANARQRAVWLTGANSISASKNAGIRLGGNAGSCPPAGRSRGSRSPSLPSLTMQGLIIGGIISERIAQSMACRASDRIRSGVSIIVRHFSANAS